MAKEKLNLKLLELDGNAFSLIGAFQKQAAKEGWTKEEIEGVLKDAMGGDYNHLVKVLSEQCVNGGA